jgi:hypothetical protein
MPALPDTILIHLAFDNTSRRRAIRVSRSFPHLSAAARSAYIDENCLTDAEKPYYLGALDSTKNRWVD